MRRLTATLLLIAALGCGGGRDCLETCAQVVADECETPDMEGCEALCGGLVEEAAAAGCEDEWSALERCLGEDPVCGGHARCAAPRGAYNDCVRAFCDAEPDLCGP